MTTLRQKLQQLPKPRQRQIAARAKRLIAAQRRTTSTADAIEADRQEREDVLVGVGPDVTRRRGTPARRAVLDHAAGDHRGRQYRCPQCERIVRRDSNKAWVKSYCDRADRVVHLQRVARSKE